MPIINRHIQSITPLLSPHMVTHTLPTPAATAKHITQSREIIHNILHGQDKRLLVIAGPCSIHDQKAALEYAHQLKQLADRLSDKLYIIMRVYFEKPRTTIGWKGLINDPHLNQTFAINDGLLMARNILLDINQIGLACATEFVDTITPQYIADLISWAAIGARTTESQPHRMLASGLSMPVGFKNNTSGDIDVAIQAVLAAANSHQFLSVTEQGVGAIVVTSGNEDCHVILRGGKNGPNYSREQVQQTGKKLSQAQLPEKIIIDCSHDNCDKDYKKQEKVIDDICQQLQQKDCAIAGIMLESNLVEGKQAFASEDKLTYGQSITDGCVSWQQTELLLQKLSDHHCMGDSHGQ